VLPDQGLPSNGASSPSPAWAAACLVWACGRRGRYVPARLTHLTGLSAAAAAAALAALLLVLGRWDAFPSQQSIQSSAWASLHPTRRKPVIKPLPITPPSVCSWLHSIPSSTNVRWCAPPCRVIFDKNHCAASMQPLPEIRLSTIGTVPVPQMAAAIRGGGTSAGGQLQIASCVCQWAFSVCTRFLRCRCSRQRARKEKLRAAISGASSLPFPSRPTLSSACKLNSGIGRVSNPLGNSSSKIKKGKSNFSAFSFVPRISPSMVLSGSNRPEIHQSSLMPGARQFSHRIIVVPLRPVHVARNTIRTICSCSLRQHRPPHHVS